MHQVSLRLLAGTVTALVGDNGAGKSTLVSLLAGRAALSAGRATLHCGAARCAVAVCPQANVLAGSLSVREHVRLFASLRLAGRRAGASSPAALAAEVATALQGVGLHEVSSLRTAVLSGGQVRRLQLACALAGAFQSVGDQLSAATATASSAVRLVLLDEPAAGLDAASRADLRRLMRAAAAGGRAVVFTSHHLEDVEAAADQVVLLSAGSVRLCGTPADLMRAARAAGERPPGSSTSVRARPAGAVLTAVFQASADAAGGEAREPWPAMQALVAAHAPAGWRLLRRCCGGGRAAGVEAAWQLNTWEPEHLRSLVAALEALLCPQTGEVVVGGGLRVCSFSLKSGPSIRDALLDVDMTWLEATNKHGRESARPPDGPDGPDGPGIGPACRLPPASLEAERANREAEAAPLVGSLFPGLEIDPSSPYPPPRLHRPRCHAIIRRLRGLAPPRPAAVRGATQLCALLRKRTQAARRDPRSCLLSVAVPLGCTAAVLAASLEGLGRGSGTAEVPALSLSCAAVANAYSQHLGVALWLDATASDSWPQPYPPPPPASTFAPACLASRPPPAASGGNSTAMSLAFLDGSFSPKTTELPPFGAVVFSDASLPRNSVARCVANESASSLGAAAAALAPLLGLSNNTAAAALSWLQSSGGQPTTLLYSPVAAYGLPALMAELHSARAVAAGAPSLSAAVHPLPGDGSDAPLPMQATAITLLLIPLALAPSSCATAALEELASGAALQQRLAGCGALSYWASHWLAELCPLAVLSAAVPPLCAAFGMAALGGVPAFVLLLCFSAAAAAAGLAAARTLRSPAAAVGTLAGFHILSGFCAVSIVETLAKNTSGRQAPVAAAAFRVIFPAYNLGEGLFGLLFFHAGLQLQLDVGFAAARLRLAPPSLQTYDWALLGRPTAALLLQAAALFALPLAVERFSNSLGGALPHAVRAVRADPETTEGGEAEAGSAAPEAQKSLVQATVHDPRSGRPALVEAAGLSLRDVMQLGQRVALLGDNGAGKTTVLRELLRTALCAGGQSGHVLMPAAALRIGYCPQSDALLMRLSARQHLELYARLAAVDLPADAAAAAAAERVGLSRCDWDKPASELSGGMRRKLSLAVALVGNPTMLLVDEPSSGGLDAQGLDALLPPHPPPPAPSCAAASCATAPPPPALVLATHSVLQAECVCNTVAVLRHGRIVAQGPAALLRARHGGPRAMLLASPLPTAAAAGGGAAALCAHLVEHLPEDAQVAWVLPAEGARPRVPHSRNESAERTVLRCTLDSPPPLNVGASSSSSPTNDGPRRGRWLPDEPQGVPAAGPLSLMLEALEGAPSLGTCQWELRSASLQAAVEAIDAATCRAAPTSDSRRWTAENERR